MEKVSNQNIFHLINQRARLLAKEMNDHLKDHGLYAAQWSIIFCLDRFGPMSQTDIWKYLHVEAPTITRTITRMEQNGWIVRTSGVDKRERIIELTPHARQKIPVIRNKMEELEDSLLADLTANEKEQLQHLLNKIGKPGERIHIERNGNRKNMDEKFY